MVKPEVHVPAVHHDSSAVCASSTSQRVPPQLCPFWPCGLAHASSARSSGSFPFVHCGQLPSQELQYKAMGVSQLYPKSFWTIWDTDAQTHANTHRFKQFWFFLYWRKQMQTVIKAAPDIIWVVCYNKVTAIWAPKKNCQLAAPPPYPTGSYRRILSKFTNFSHKPNFTENSKPQHDAHNMAWKSNTKVCNSSAQLVKACNPHCSQCVLCDFAWHIFFFFFLTTVRFWEMQFQTDKLTVFP